MANEVTTLQAEIAGSAEKRDQLVARQRNLINQRDDAVGRSHARDMLTANEALAQSTGGLTQSCAEICDQLDEFRAAVIEDFTKEDLAVREGLRPIQAQLRERRDQVKALEAQEAAELNRITPLVIRIANIREERLQFASRIEFENTTAMTLVALSRMAA